MFCVSDPDDRSNNERPGSDGMPCMQSKAIWEDSGYLECWKWHIVIKRDRGMCCDEERKKYAYGIVYGITVALDMDKRELF